MKSAAQPGVNWMRLFSRSCQRDTDLFLYLFIFLGVAAVSVDLLCWSRCRDRKLTLPFAGLTAGDSTASYRSAEDTAAVGTEGRREGEGRTEGRRDGRTAILDFCRRPCGLVPVAKAFFFIRQGGGR